jgi:hypothetical protein
MDDTILGGSVAYLIVQSGTHSPKQSGTLPQSKDKPKESLSPNEDKLQTREENHVRKPTVDQVREYVQRKGYSEVDPEMFIAHYESNGWRVGKVSMINWRSAVATWHRMRMHWRKQRENKPRLPYRVRQNRINELNQQKQSLIRAGAPYWKIQQIDNQLSKL